MAGLKYDIDTILGMTQSSNQYDLANEYQEIQRVGNWGMEDDAAAVTEEVKSSMRAVYYSVERSLKELNDFIHTTAKTFEALDLKLAAEIETENKEAARGWGGRAVFE